MAVSLSTQVPFGNACDVEVEERGPHTDVSFAADPHGGPERLWFCFRLIHSGQPQKIKLVLKHFESMLGADASGASLRPVLRKQSEDWERLPQGRLETLGDGRLRLAWDLELSASADVALCYPYGHEELEKLVTDSAGYWRKECIGVSQAGRPLLRLSNGHGELESRRPGLYLVARQHSGETPGSWVLDGLLRHMASLKDKAPLVWALPLANIDGVVQGDYGKDNYPWDLNRAWDAASMRHEVLSYQADVLRWRQRCQPVFMADFHAPGLMESDGIYCYLPPWNEIHFRDLVNTWTDPIGESLGHDFAATEFGQVANYPSRFNSGSLFHIWARREQGLPATTFETPYSMIHSKVLSRSDYQEAGARIASGILARLGK